MINRQFFTLLFFNLLLAPGFSQQAQAQSTNSKHKPLVQLWENKVDDEWQTFRRVEYLYDEKDQLIEESTLLVVPEGFKPQFRLLRAYNEQGELLKVIRETWSGEGWGFAQQFRYIYGSGKVISRMDSSLQNGVFSMLDVTYEYDNDGRLKAEVSRSVQYAKRVNRSKVVYHYDTNGRAIEKEFPLWSGTKWSNSRKMILKYDDRGNHVQTTRFNWETDDWSLFVDYDLKLDEKGRRTREIWLRPIEEGINEFMRISYEYAKTH